MLWLSLIFALSPAHAAQSVITEADIRLALDNDGTLNVVEHFTVEDAGGLFAGGFYRDIPTTRIHVTGLRSVSRFELSAARLDGKPVQVTARRVPRGRRITFPTTTQNRHSFELVYRTDRRLGFFPNDSELHWPAVANEWELPVHKVRVTLDLDGRHLLRYNGEAAENTPAKTNLTKRALTFTGATPAKGVFHITAGFPANAFTQPSPAEERQALITDNLHLWIGLGGCLLLLGFLLLARRRCVSPPPELARAPEVSQPRLLSPCAARYAAFASVGAQGLAAIWIELERKGFAQTKRENGQLIAVRRADGDRSKLSGEERAAADGLFAELDEVPLTQETLNKSAAALTLAVTSRWLPQLRARRVWLIISGWALSAGIVSAMRLAAVPGLPTPMDALWALCVGLLSWGLGAFAAGMWLATYLAWRRASGASERRMLISLVAIALGCFSFGAVVAAADFFSRLFIDIAPLLVGIGGTLMLLNLWALGALRGPTSEGWQAIAEVSGLRAFLHGHKNGVPAELLAYAAALESEHNWPQGQAQALNAATKAVSALETRSEATS
jgi:hypothetical protein